MTTPTDKQPASQPRKPSASAGGSVSVKLSSKAHNRSPVLHLGNPSHRPLLVLLLCGISVVVALLIGILTPRPAASPFAALQIAQVFANPATTDIASAINDATSVDVSTLPSSTRTPWSSLLSAARSAASAATDAAPARAAAARLLPVLIDQSSGSMSQAADASQIDVTNDWRKLIDAAAEVQAGAYPESLPAVVTDLETRLRTYYQRPDPATAAFWNEQLHLYGNTRGDLGTLVTGATHIQQAVLAGQAMAHAAMAFTQSFPAQASNRTTTITILFVLLLVCLFAISGIAALPLVKGSKTPTREAKQISKLPLDFSSLIKCLDAIANDVANPLLAAPLSSSPSVTASLANATTAALQATRDRQRHLQHLLEAWRTAIDRALRSATVLVKDVRSHRESSTIANEHAVSVLASMRMDLGEIERVKPILNNIMESMRVGEAALADAKTAQHESRRGLELAGNATREVTQSLDAIATSARHLADRAEQMELLAVQGALAAARSGEAGRGFAPIAANMHEQASEARAATAETFSALHDLRTAAEDAARRTEAGLRQSDEAARVSDVLGEEWRILATHHTDLAGLLETPCENLGQKTATAHVAEHAMVSDDVENMDRHAQATLAAINELDGLLESASAEQHKNKAP